MESCEICGRTVEELEELGRSTEIVEHQGISKCETCAGEYIRAEEEDDSEESTEYSDWKQAVNA